RALVFVPRRTPPPSSPLFPYTTLFRSLVNAQPARRSLGSGLDPRLRDRAQEHRHAELGGGFGDGRAPAGIEGLQRADGRQHDGKDRKSTRLNSSHLGISYAVFCLKKKR